MNPALLWAAIAVPSIRFYLSWRAREFDLATEFIELAGKLNQQMHYHCVAKVARVPNGVGGPVHGSHMTIFGVSYKPGVGDTRQSPAIKIATLLRAQGADLIYHDPRVPVLHDNGLHSLSLEEAISAADLGLIVTAHPGFDHDLIAERVPLVVDLRGVTRGAHSARGVRL